MSILEVHRLLTNKLKGYQEEVFFFFFGEELPKRFRCLYIVHVIDSIP